MIATIDAFCVYWVYNMIGVRFLRVKDTYRINKQCIFIIFFFFLLNSWPGLPSKYVRPLLQRSVVIKTREETPRYRWGKKKKRIVLVLFAINDLGRKIILNRTTPVLVGWYLCNINNKNVLFVFVVVFFFFFAVDNFSSMELLRFSFTFASKEITGPRIVILASNDRFQL